MSKIIVTGGAGFIGSHLVDALVEKNHEVVIFDNLESQVHKKFPDYLNTNAGFIQADIRHKESLKRIIQDVDVLFHLAAMVGVGQSMYQIERYIDVNTLGTAKLLDTLVNEEHSIKKLIVASSMSIYGEGAYKCDNCGIIYPPLRSVEQFQRREWEHHCPHCGNLLIPIPTNENKPLQPTSIYAISKKDQEEMCLAIGRTYGIPTVALRYFNSYGPRQALSNPYTGVCAIFSARIKNNNSPVVFEDGNQTRDFVYVKDIVQANLLAMTKSNANYEIFNVGSGKPTPIRSIAEILARLYKTNIQPTIENKFRNGDIRHCFADISKIRDKLGYAPQTSFETGMQILVDWGERQEAKDGFQGAYEELLRRGLVER